MIYFFFQSTKLHTIISVSSKSFLAYLLILTTNFEMNLIWVEKFEKIHLQWLKIVFGRADESFFKIHGTV